LKPNPSFPDPVDFAAFFEQYKNLVYKTAFLMLGEAPEAEEALQEVFVRVHRSLGAYDAERGALTTWLHRITVNYCLEQRRKPRLDLLPMLDEDAAAGSPPEEARFGVLAEREAMLQAIRQLGEKLQAVVILRFYWDLPYAEIAEVLEIPLGTVKSRIDLALRSLRRMLMETKETRPALPGGLSMEEEARP
jgi:RNA polymerase sigma-70 factor, ECF subfamily